MEEVMKMLRAVISGQSSMKAELLGEIRKVREEARLDRKDIKKEVKKNGKRIDKLGAGLAYLEDDVPTRKEHHKLEKRVEKVEGRVASL